MSKQTASLDTRQLVGSELQSMLVELIDLSLQGKQAHWNVTGPNFLPLHEQLDEMVEACRTWADQVAERAVALGFSPDGRVATIAQDAAIPAFPEGAVADRAVIGLFVDRLSEVVERARGRMERLGELDLVSQDLLLDIVAGLEKQLWMLRAQQS